MEIKKACKHCGAEFIAHNPKNCFCSAYCRDRHEKETMRKRAIEAHREELSRIKTINAEDSEILSVCRVAALLGLHRATVYRYINAGILPAIQLPGKTLIRKKDILSLFESPAPLRERMSKPQKQKKNTPPTPAPDQTAAPVQCVGYISVPELARKYHVTPNTVRDYLRKFDIPDMIYRTCRYYEAEKAEKAFRLREKNNHPEIKEWYTIKEIMAKYDMEMPAVYNMVHDHDIPRRHYKNSMLYSKVHVDRLRAVPDDIKENYVTVKDLMEQYHFTHSQIHNRLKRHNITRKVIVRTLWVNRHEFERSLHIE